MDTLTHGITGALVGKAFFSDRHGRPATVAVTLGAVFPDSDVFSALFAPNELATLESHRGVTHSFIALPAFAALLAGLTCYLLRRRAGPRFMTLWGLYALGLALHILLDLITSFGTMIWSPLSTARPAWDLVFIIDLAFTGIVLLPQVVAWIYRQRVGALRRGVLTLLFFVAVGGAIALLAAPIFDLPFPTRTLLGVSGALGGILLLPRWASWGFNQPRALYCRIGVAALAGYLALCTAAHGLAVRRVEEFARANGLEVKSLAALPGPPTVLRWSALILTSGGVYQSSFSLWDTGQPAFDYVASAPPNHYIERAEQLSGVKTYRWFARFPVVSHRVQGEGKGRLHIIEYTDLRFAAGGLRRRQNPAAFTYRVLLNAEGEVVSAGFAEP